MTKSKFAAQVILDWYNKKAPALSPTDSTARAMVIDQENQVRSVQNNPQLMSKLARTAKKSGRAVAAQEVSSIDGTVQRSASDFIEAPPKPTTEQIQANIAASRAKRPAQKARLAQIIPFPWERQ